MTSKSLSKNRFLYPESEPEHEQDANGKKYKKANVYDAVAGKISSNGFIPKQRVYASTRDTASSSTTAVAPENVLFKRKDAPVRYVENDFYFANERQSIAGLPDSDLVTAIHSYTSDFYSRALPDGRKNWKSLDETALLALGILMEEASRETLGLSGDLAFTEGEEVKERLAKLGKASNSHRSDSDIRHSKKRKVDR